MISVPIHTVRRQGYDDLWHQKTHYYAYFRLLIVVSSLFLITGAQDFKIMIACMLSGSLLIEQIFESCEGFDITAF